MGKSLINALHLPQKKKTSGCGQDENNSSDGAAVGKRVGLRAAGD